MNELRRLIRKMGAKKKGGEKVGGQKNRPLLKNKINGKSQQKKIWAKNGGIKKPAYF